VTTINHTLGTIPIRSGNCPQRRGRDAADRLRRQIPGR